MLRAIPANAALQSCHVNVRSARRRTEPASHVIYGLGAALAVPARYSAGGRARHYRFLSREVSVNYDPVTVFSVCV